MSTRNLNDIPISGWQGEVLISEIESHSSGTPFKVTGGTADTVVMPVTNVSVSSSLNILTEARLGQRTMVIIPAPIIFNGTFEVLRTKNNNWLHELMLGEGSNHLPYQFTLRASEMAPDEQTDPSVGIECTECYITNHATAIAANGVMRTTYSFTAVNMYLVTAEGSDPQYLETQAGGA